MKTIHLKTMSMIILCSLSLNAKLSLAQNIAPAADARGFGNFFQLIKYFKGDCRNAGSNPAGALGLSPGTPIPLAQATPTRLEILSDLNGNGIIEAEKGEQVLYEFIDDPTHANGLPDQVHRIGRQRLVVENVKDFRLSYRLTSGVWVEAPADTALVRLVKIELVKKTGELDEITGEPLTIDLEFTALLRNFL